MLHLLECQVVGADRRVVWAQFVRLLVIQFRTTAGDDVVLFFSSRRTQQQSSHALRQRREEQRRAARRPQEMLLRRLAQKCQRPVGSCQCKEWTLTIIIVFKLNERSSICIVRIIQEIVVRVPLDTCTVRKESRIDIIS